MGMPPLLVPEEVIRAIIGPQGSTVKAIQAETGAYLDFVGNHLRILGSKPSIEAAQARVEKIITANTPDQAVVDCPAILFDFLKRAEPGEQSHLDKIRSESGCRTVRGHWDKAGCTKILISGTGDSVNVARKMVGDVIRQNAKAEGMVDFPPVLMGVLNRRNQQGLSVLEEVRDRTGVTNVYADRDTCTIFIVGAKEPCTRAMDELADVVTDLSRDVESIEILDHHQGSIIGSKGSTINQLSRESGCEISVSSKLKSVFIKGAAENRERAKEMVQEIVAGLPVEPPAARQRGMDSDRCYNCQKRGHMAKDCPERGGHGAAAASPQAGRPGRQAAIAKGARPDGKQGAAARGGRR
eukprot:NODE_131_length_1339_cov_617.318605_g104_i0.p1 GENE.NODE_131_length_1339_cov_617.318605_g104_i0~~NODE_131_length_1339_cov_617.318605_g104_i0.p1  ORF type:complete len:354 (-),score=79.63 NODE_131_length_1339_cov_617.318605_g104_i0:246-1307(-)